MCCRPVRMDQLGRRSSEAMNIDELQNASKKDLADQAKSLGIAGFGAMVKDDLIKAIARALKKKAKEREKAKAAKMKSAPAPLPSLNGKHHTNGKPSATSPAVLAIPKKVKVEAKKPETVAVVNPTGA